MTANLGDAASNLVFDGGTLQITGTTLTSFTGSGHTVVFNTNKNVGLDINDVTNTFTADQILNQGTGSLTKLGVGTLVLNQANTYTGGTNINAGILNLGTGQSGSGGPLGGTGTVASVGTIKFGGGTLQFSASNAVDYSSRFSGSASQPFNIDANGQTVTFASLLASTGGTLTKLGAGTLITTSSSNSYAGTTTISAGTLQLGNNGTTGALATGSAIVNNGTLTISRTNNTFQGTDFSGAAITGTGSLVQDSSRAYASKFFSL